MKTKGVIREIDEVGRIVIPKEIRNAKGIGGGTTFEIYSDGDSIILKRAYNTCIFCGEKNEGALITFKDKPVCKTCLSLMKEEN